MAKNKGGREIRKPKQDKKVKPATDSGAASLNIAAKRAKKLK